MEYGVGSGIYSGMYSKCNIFTAGGSSLGFIENFQNEILLSILNIRQQQLFKHLTNHKNTNE